MSSPFLWAHQMEMQQQRESVEEKLNWFFFRFDKMSKALNPVDGGKEEEEASTWESCLGLWTKTRTDSESERRKNPKGKKLRNAAKEESGESETGQGNAPIVDSFPRQFPSALHIVYLLLLINLNLLTQISLWRLLASRVLCSFLIEEMQVKAGKEREWERDAGERERETALHSGSWRLWSFDATWIKRRYDPALSIPFPFPVPRCPVPLVIYGKMTNFPLEFRSV